VDMGEFYSFANGLNAIQVEPISDEAKYQFKSVVATADGSIYALTKSTLPTFAFIEVFKTEVKLQQKLQDGPYEKQNWKGIAADLQNVYLHTSDVIYFAPHISRGDPSAWKPFAEPLGENGSYENLFACSDGGLLATINKVIFLWDGDAWKVNKNDYGRALCVSKLPIIGWEMFGGIKTAIDDLRDCFKPPKKKAISS
jgi:hypothetical protein